MIILILVILALVLVVIGLLVATYFVVSNNIDLDTAGAVLFMLLLPVILLTIPSFMAKVRDIGVRYKEPTAIIRTNNVTDIVFIGADGDSRNWAYKEATYWNAPQLAIEETSGRNLWGIKIQNDYGVVVTNSAVLER